MARRTQYRHGANTEGKHKTPWQQREAMRGVPFLRAPRPTLEKAEKELLVRIVKERAR